MIVLYSLLPIYICVLLIAHIDNQIIKSPAEKKFRQWYFYSPLTTLILILICGASWAKVSLKAGILFTGFSLGQWGYRRLPNKDHFTDAMQETLLSGKTFTKEYFRNEHRKLYEQSEFEHKYAKAIYTFGNMLLSLAIVWIIVGWGWDIIKWLKK